MAYLAGRSSLDDTHCVYVVYLTGRVALSVRHRYKAQTNDALAGAPTRLAQLATCCRKQPVHSSTQIHLLECTGRCLPEVAN